MKLSIIVVNFGHSAKIKQLLNSIVKFPPQIPFEVIVVDNNSPRNDVVNVEKFCETKNNCHLIKLAENRGFGGGNNEGIKFASGDILALVNPDIQITENCLDELIKSLEKDKKNGIVAPQLLNPDLTLQDSMRDFPTIRDLFFRRFLNYKNPHKDQANIWIHGCFFVIRKDLYEKVGGFDERFFLFFEDTDLCRKVLKAGFLVKQVQTAQAIHSNKRLSGKNISSIFTKFFWIHTISMIKYFWKWKK